MIKFLLLLIISKEVWSSNILMVGLTTSHSHHFWIEAMALGLVNNGHNVTFLSLDETKVKRDNYTVITLDGVYKELEPILTSDSFQHVVLTPFTIPSFIHFFTQIMLDLCEIELDNPVLHKTLLSYPNDFKFDLILWDHGMGECMYPIIERFGNPPTIGLSPYGLTDTVEVIYGGHTYPYIGNVVLPFTTATSFYDRLVNAMYINYNMYIRSSNYKQKTVELSRKYFRDWDVSKMERVEQDFNLVLMNWNAAINEAQPLNPSMIPVGGIQIKENIPLKKEIKEIFAKKSKGVIYFSLGSNAKSETLSALVLKSFVDCFAELTDYEVIWKIQPPSTLKLPSNVHAVPWAQQTAILEQTKTKLFISHGGGLSTQETSYFGVPVIGLPMFLDQINNVDKLRVRNAGELVHVADMAKSKDVFCKTVKQVLFDEKYASSMKKISAKYRDTPMRPLDTAIYWVNYVLKHGDARHLSPASRTMSIFYTQNLDIYLFVVVVLMILIYCVLIVLKLFWRLFGKGVDKQKIL